ncbi:IPP transferase-domain-containing protein [Staphylotrichum tortipilum]|uniref:tRNA dimethylallyltransferase n=1 Tax=Staphylotrichum tortipilum TaxID=2831512 RepID=A0AAN6RSJ0_9PEZI|nr:IPP transferase-domain-containing protein [Staphylotrichum longicolle]
MGFLSRLAPVLRSLLQSSRSPVVARMRPLIIIYGSTGTGKSDLAVELATRYNGEIINADAMQLYKGLPIITNKLTVPEQRGIPHHLLGAIDLDEDPWVVTRFKKEASRIISEIRARGRLPIVVGGTSYYLDGLLFEGRVVDDQPALGDGAVSNREALAEQYPILNDTPEAMLAKLREVDPVMADKWHPNDGRKIRTSLEIYFANGRPASEIYAEQRARKESKWASAEGDDARDHSLGDILLFWLYARREALNERLDTRVDKMVQSGLVGETAEVYDYLQGQLAAGETVDRSKGIWQSIGFRQFEPYLAALKESPDSAAAATLAKLKEAGIEDTKTATRQYAKYQVRWMTMKTIPSLRDERLLSRLYLLDSTDLTQWRHDVLETGVSLTRQFLAAAEPLPAPADVSETAREVLAGSLERSTREDTPCRRTCDVCGGKTFLTEELWRKHVEGRKHKSAVRGAKKRMLIPAGAAPSRALMVVETGEEGTEGSRSSIAVEPGEVGSVGEEEIDGP